METIFQTVILLAAAITAWADLKNRVTRVEDEVKLINGRVTRLEDK